jgi:ribose-phosphate pyrophosphokinase
MQILSFPDYDAPARRLAQELNAPCAAVDLHYFPDGESLIRLPLPLPLDETVIVCRSLNRPNGKLVELMLTAATARSHGVRRLVLVAPYLCYQRQDTAFRAGESVSQQIVGAFLARYFDELITVDPHLHRVASIEESVPCRRAVSCTAAPLIASFLRGRSNNPLLVGPDSESRQWVGAIAGGQNLDYVVASKSRHGDRKVEIEFPAFEYAGRDVVLIDDVVSTGCTLATAARHLRRAGVRSVDCLVTHCLLTPEAETALREAGIEWIWSTDSIEHASNVIELAPLLAEAVVRDRR